MRLVHRAHGHPASAGTFRRRVPLTAAPAEPRLSSNTHPLAEEGGGMPAARRSRCSPAGSQAKQAHAGLRSPPGGSVRAAAGLDAKGSGGPTTWLRVLAHPPGRTCLGFQPPPTLYLSCWQPLYILSRIKRLLPRFPSWFLSRGDTYGRPPTLPMLWAPRDCCLLRAGELRIAPNPLGNSDSLSRTLARGTGYFPVGRSQGAQTTTLRGGHVPQGKFRGSLAPALRLSVLGESGPLGPKPPAPLTGRPVTRLGRGGAGPIE